MSVHVATCALLSGELAVDWILGGKVLRNISAHKGLRIIRFFV